MLEVRAVMPPKNEKSFKTILLISVLLVAVSASAEKRGQVLHVFNTTYDTSPEGNVVFDAAGNIYGTSADTFYCFMGPPCGEIWELTPTSGGQWQKNVLHDF